MSSLSAPQKDIIVALLELYDKKRALVKSKEIASKTGRDEGTVRNIMPVRGQSALSRRYPTQGRILADG
jgi:predicted transcriptional regulator